MELTFYKMHGFGNDFAIILNPSYSLSEELIKKLSHRNVAIGFDQFIILRNQDNKFYMEIYNANGSPALACGNATRCAIWLLETIYNTAPPIQLQLSDRIIEGRVKKDNIIEVNMGQAHTQKLNFTTLTKYDIGDWYLVNVGNEHLISVSNKKLSIEEIKQIGEEIHRDISPRVNINFLLHDGNLITYEAGSGLTLACGTGAMASSAVLYNYYECSPPIRIIPSLFVKEFGSKEYLEFSFAQNNDIWMSGPVTMVYKATIALNDFIKTNII